MKKEIPICTGCRMKNACHPALTPETLDQDGHRTPITPKHTHVVDYYCRHFTCDLQGKESAKQAQKSGKKAKYTVRNFTGFPFTITAATFGSPDKPTQQYKLRIVSLTGNIYSLQNDMYYRVGQI